MRVVSLSAAFTLALVAASSSPLQSNTRLVPSAFTRPNLRSVNSPPLVTSGLPLVGRFLASCGALDKYVISFTQHRADRQATAT